MPIVINNLSKSYGNNKVFDKYNLQFENNTITCIMGPSGSGKTTLLRILMGLENPDRGQIDGLEELRKSAVFQEDRLCENLSASSNIRLVCGGYESAEKIQGALHEVGLSSENARQTVREMSGGQRRRIALLRALFAEYDILFLDEPFKGLDEDTKVKTIDYVKKETNGKTVIMVTHDLTECNRFGGNIISL